MAHLSFQQYTRYFVVGSLLGLLVLVLREAIARALPGDTPINFAISIAIVYAIGMVLGYSAHRRFTFAQKRAWSLTQLGAFTVAALIGEVVTLLVALLTRYGLSLDQLVGPLSPTLAFTAGAVTASVVSYLLQARFVFRVQIER